MEHSIVAIPNRGGERDGLANVFSECSRSPSPSFVENGDWNCSEEAEGPHTEAPAKQATDYSMPNYVLRFKKACCESGETTQVEEADNRECQTVSPAEDGEESFHARVPVLVCAGRRNVVP
jgi:hypothetical protein